jgi:hypothetical protein
LQPTMGNGVECQYAFVRDQQVGQCWARSAI